MGTPVVRSVKRNGVGSRTRFLRPVSQEREQVISFPLVRPLTMPEWQWLRRRRRAAPRSRSVAAEAGIVDWRILDVATELFLELGYGRTTLDRVSQLSSTGKSARYGRYPERKGCSPQWSNVQFSRCSRTLLRSVQQGYPALSGDAGADQHLPLVPFSPHPRVAEANQNVPTHLRSPGPRHPMGPLPT